MTDRPPPNAAALTPSLFLGEVLRLPHVTVSSAEQAVEVIRGGGTALTDSRTVAMDTMLRLGIPLDEAHSRLWHATQIIDGRLDHSWLTRCDRHRGVHILHHPSP